MGHWDHPKYRLNIQHMKPRVFKTNMLEVTFAVPEIFPDQNHSSVSIVSFSNNHG